MPATFRFKGSLTAFLGRHRAPVLAVMAAAMVTQIASGIAAPGPVFAPGSQRVDTATLVDVVSRFKHTNEDFIRAANEESAKYGIGTCFGAQAENVMDSSTLRQDLEESTIYLLMRDGDAVPISQGTGTKIANSGDRILTATHVAILDDAPSLTTFKAYTSKGVLLGDVKVVAVGQQADDKSVTNGKNDTAVMELSPSTPEARAAWDDIKGLKINPVLPATSFSGMFGSATKPGVWFGSSGGALVTSDGFVQAVASYTSFSKSELEDGRLVSLHGASLMDMVMGSDDKEDVILPRVSDMTFASLDPAVLAALGHASDGVRFESGETGGDSLKGRPVFVAGYSRSSCHVSEGRIQQTYGLDDKLDNGSVDASNSRMLALDDMQQTMNSIDHVAGYGTVPPSIAATETGLGFHTRTPPVQANSDRDEWVEAIMDGLSRREPGVEVSFQSVKLGQGTVEMVLLDNRIGMYPDIAHAVIAIDAMGGIVNQRYCFDGQSLGHTQDEAITAYETICMPSSMRL